MTGFRLAAPWGAQIERSRPVRFNFNGRSHSGFVGDTVASALLANGVKRVARSFKLHRPRGIFSCGVEEPNALVDVGSGGRRLANVRATLLPIQEGMNVESVNCWPSVEFDLAAVNGLLAPLLPVGFYYKTFKWPDWRWFEPTVRRMAGLGRAPRQADPDLYDEVSASVDVLVVGAGVSGLAAAVAAARAGAKVTIVSQGSRIGANALWRTRSVNAAQLIEELDRLGVQALPNAAAFGLYDHNLVCVRETLDRAGAVEPGGPPIWRERLWKFRARDVVCATGAFERPMIFPNNDRPGVMLAGAAQQYAHAYGVACGTRAVIVANSDSAYEVAQTMKECNIEVVAVVDCRPPHMIRSPLARSDQFYSVQNATISAVKGGRQVSGCVVSSTQDGSRHRAFECDLILSAGGITPAVHLHSQAGGKLRWDDRGSMFVPDGPAPHVFSVGAAAGIFDGVYAVEHAHQTGLALARGTTPPLPKHNDSVSSLRSSHVRQARGKQFVDLQNDVTASDVELAARENYRSVEHLKRYTTTGMGTDQGKTSNINALVLLGEATERAPGEVGTTKFRPPFAPISLGVLAGYRRGELLRPRKSLAAHSWHESRGALFEDYGGWLRPAAYPLRGESVEQATYREACAVRKSVGVFDGSPLGKMEVFGPDAARFLDFMYVGTMSNLAIGRAKYGLLLNENGVVVDDGIVARLAEERFWINTSSAGAERTAAAFEEWKQCEFPSWKVLITPVTARWANVTVSGPRAWEWLNAIGFEAALAPKSSRHMSILDTQLGALRLRVLRASFSGELGYEINVPSDQCQELLEQLWRVGKQFGAVAYGVEALQMMRIEKGYIHIGTDTDGTTLPTDIGMSDFIARKASDFVGRRSLQRPAALDADRLQLVALMPVDRKTPIPVGGQIARTPPPGVSEGHITSSAISPELGVPIALAMLQGGSSRKGEYVQVHHFGISVCAEVVTAPFVDPEGRRVHG